MHSLAFNIRYRPFRIGWCVRANNLDALRRTARQNFTLWGGNRNPMIVVDNEKVAADIVESANVDVLLSVSDDDQQIKDFIARFPHLPRVGLFHDSALFVSHRKGHEAPLFLDVVTSSRHRARVAASDARAEHMQFHDFSWDDDDPLQNSLIFMYGSFPRDGEPGASIGAQVRSLHAVGLTDLKGHAPLPRDSFRWSSVRYLTGRVLERDIWERFDPNGFGYFIGSTDSFYDLVNYWNLRASGQAIAFLDPDHFERFREFCNGWLAWLSLNEPPAKISINAVDIWTAMDPQAVDLSWVTLPQVHHRGDPASLRAVKIPLEHFPEQSALANVGKGRDGHTATIPLPKLPFDIERYQSRRLAVTVLAGFSLPEDEAITFQTPFIRKLNRYYGDKYFWEWYAARVEPRGLALLSDHVQDSISVRALRVGELFQEFFAQYGIKAVPSKAGLVTSRVIDQMGGVNSCRAFRVGGLRSLIESTRPETSFTRPHAIQSIRQQQLDRSIGFDRYADLHIEPRPIGVKLKPEDVFRYMVGRGAFRVGLQFQCTECALDFWVSLDNARSSQECEFCGKHFDVTSQLKDRDWRYRRSGVFGKEDSQEGAIPVALTLLRFYHMGGMSNPIFVTARNLIAKTARVPDCETDFAALFTERRRGAEYLNLVIGECKTRKAITAADVQNLIAVANVFEDQGIGTYVVFSKLAEFTRVEIEHISTVNRNGLTRAIVFTEKELEPWFPYKWAEASGKKTFHGNSLESFAEATETLYLHNAAGA